MQNDKNLESTLKQIWPSFTGPDIDFWKLEWEKHGTWSNLKQNDYFQLTSDRARSLGQLESVLSDAGLHFALLYFVLFRSQRILYWNHY